jgi:hypothetical protein
VELIGTDQLFICPTFVNFRCKDRNSTDKNSKTVLTAINETGLPAKAEQRMKIVRSGIVTRMQHRITEK